MVGDISDYIYHLYFKTVGNITQTNSLATSLSVSVRHCTIGWLCSVIGDISGYIHHLYFKTVGNITQTNSLATYLSVSVRHCTIGWLCSVVGDISGHIHHLYFKTVGNITQTNLLAILSSGICSSLYNRLAMLCDWGHFWSYSSLVFQDCRKHHTD